MAESLKPDMQKEHTCVTCPYCGAELHQHKREFYCSFCRMKVHHLDTQRNSRRLPLQKMKTVLDVHLKKSTPELMQFSTLELLELLKIGREERKEMHELLLTIQKLSAAGEKKELEREENISRQDYERITRKVFAIETLLKQRLDFVPSRITEEALERYTNKVRADKKQLLHLYTEY